MFYFCGLISFLHTFIHLLLFQMNKCIVCHIYHLPIYLPTHYNTEMMIKTSVINSDFQSLLKNECWLKKEAFKATLNGNFILYHIFISMILQKMTFFPLVAFLPHSSPIIRLKFDTFYILSFLFSVLGAPVLINSFIYVFFLFIQISEG